MPDSAEGHEMESPPEGLEVEDWSGWLVPPEELEKAFNILGTGRAAMDKYAFDFVWVTWSEDPEGKIGIHFEVLLN